MGEWWSAVRAAKQVLFDDVDEANNGVLYVPVDAARVRLHVEAGVRREALVGDLDTIVRDVEAVVGRGPAVPLLLHLAHALQGARKEVVACVAAEYLRCMRRAAVDPGTAPGLVAAQSLGAPITQMTLNTFHR